jgi:hypothetical protein
MSLQTKKDRRAALRRCRREYITTPAAFHRLIPPGVLRLEIVAVGADCVRTNLAAGGTKVSESGICSQTKSKKPYGQSAVFGQLS